MKRTTNVSVKVLGFELGNIEIVQEGSQTFPGLERRAIGVRKDIVVDSDLIKPIAREAVAFLEPFAGQRVESDPAFDEAFASGYDTDMALDILLKSKFTVKGIIDMTYQLLLSGPLSEQKDLAPIFKAAIKNVVNNHLQQENLSSAY